MPDGLQERTKKDRHVVAIPGSELEHSACRVDELHPVGISGISDIPLRPLEQRIDFAQVVLGRNPPHGQDVDGVPAHIEVFGACSYQRADATHRPQRSGIPARDALDVDLWEA
jgi:hypothetical protein